MFFDRAKIFVQAGDGGNGAVSFRREKFVDKGGPNGGTGGRGGNVYLVVDPRLNTLGGFRYKVHHRAEKGVNGGGSDKTGRNGVDLRIGVPAGTIARHDETDEILAELVHPDQEVLIMRGGRGGRGNASFKNSRNYAPQIAERGEPIEEMWVRLELKLVADVGIIGVPNAGKSTLLSVVSAAKPKIAAYPFTTVVPNLGVAEVNHRQIVLVDIPGLMEGAHEGIGLGLDFLRHIERTRVLIHVINGDSPDPLGDFEAIQQELELFSPVLLEKPQCVVFNKMDLPHAREKWPEVEEAIKAHDLPVLSISAVTGENVQQLLYKAQELLDALPPQIYEPTAEELPEITPAEDENRFRIFKIDEETWRVEGTSIERTARMTNWEYYESGLRFQRILQAMGISNALRKAGVEDGHTVQIADTELIWGYENAFGE